MDGAARKVPSAEHGVEAVFASPESVLSGERSRWLDLFTDDACIEDPVGAARYDDRKRRAAFWDTFIAPPAEDRVSAATRLRGVAPRRPAGRHRYDDAGSGRAAERPGHHRVSGHRRAHRSAAGVLVAVGATVWFAAQGRSGWGALARHNVRIARKLGVRSLVAFGAALRPSVAPARAKGWVESFIGSTPIPRWVDDIEVEAHDASGISSGTEGLRGAIAALGSSPQLDQLVCAGREVAAVVTGSEASAAILIDGGAGMRPRRVRVVASGSHG